MRRVKYFTLAVIAVLLAARFQMASAKPASAKPARIWPYDQLWREADLVVIATVKSTRGVKHALGEDPPENAWVPVDSIFATQAVLKGKIDGNTMTLRHYRFYRRGFVAAGGPTFVEFNVKKAQRYLMFLKRSGQVYEPVTGQYDANQSFNALQPYRAADER